MEERELVLKHGLSLDTIDLYLGRRAITRSKEQFDSQLHLSGRPGAEDPAEILCEGDPIRYIEVGPIEQVEDLPAQFESHPTRQRRVLADRQVHVRISRRDDDVAAGGPERERRRWRKAIDVEPLVGRVRRPCIRVAAPDRPRCWRDRSRGSP
jgi:hypothetical protein